MWGEEHEETGQRAGAGSLGSPSRCGKAEGTSSLTSWNGGSRGVTHSCVRTTTSSKEKATATARPRSRFSRIVATKVTSQMSYKQTAADRIRRGHWG